MTPLQKQRLDMLACMKFRARGAYDSVSAKAVQQHKEWREALIRSEELNAVLVQRIAHYECELQKQRDTILRLTGGAA